MSVLVHLCSIADWPSIISLQRGLLNRPRLWAFKSGAKDRNRVIGRHVRHGFMLYMTSRRNNYEDAQSASFAAPLPPSALPVAPKQVMHPCVARILGKEEGSIPGKRR